MSSKRENKVASLSVERKKLLKTNNWKHSFSTWKKKWTNVLPILVIFTLENVFIVNFKYLNRGKLLQKDEVLSLVIVQNQTFSKFTTTVSIQFYVMPGKNKIYIPILIRCKWCNGIYISWGGLRWTINNRKHICHLKMTVSQIHTKQRQLRQTTNALVHESNWKNLYLNGDILTVD